MGREGDGERGRRGMEEGARRKGKGKAIEEKRISNTEINSKTLKGFNINNPGLGETACSDLSETQPGVGKELQIKAHLQS